MFGAEVAAAAIAHALEETPRESVGAVVAGDYRPLSNIAENPEETFRVAAGAMTALYRDGLQALVHSHREMPFPSRHDMESQINMALPWGIVSLSPGMTPDLFWWGGEPAPLLGRSFRPGVADCWSAVRDWHRIETGIVLMDFPREPEWWERGENLILDRFAQAGLAETDEAPRRGDILFFQPPKIAVPNHAAVYLGDGLIFHHLAGRLSRRESLHPWRKWMKHVVRYEPGEAS